MLNPGLNVDLLRTQYQQDHRVRIDGFLAPTVADEIEQCLRQVLDFDLIFFNEGTNYAMSEDDLSSVGSAGRQKLQQELAKLASEGIGFLYSGYRMEGDKLDLAPPVLRDLYDFINSEQVLGLIASITGVEEIKSASGQYTRYTAGQYLTRHSDDVRVEGRLMAYVLNFTRQWHPDWGGLLQFYENNGVPRDAWEPRFNSVSLFDVAHVHSVTYVVPHALMPRYALTGWFNSQLI
jgi:Rps23 Pro-64 3,4-dihydroxylase Tpa1-like proline 4-hydroxylase